MKVRVRMFGALAERAAAEESVELPGGEPIAADVVAAVRRAHPAAAPILDRVSIAVNREMAHGERRISDGDEIALMPPVAGGATIVAGLRARPSVEEAVGAVASPRAGGTCVFVGTVRDHSEGGAVERLTYSAYEEMAETVLEEIAVAAADKWGLEGVAVLHGARDMRVGDVTVVVACSAPHRAEAFEACRWVIDETKARVPVWKKETGPHGSRWVGIEP